MKKASYSCSKIERKKIVGNGSPRQNLAPLLQKTTKQIQIYGVNIPI